MSAVLTARGVAHRNGQVLTACATAGEPVASEVIRELGLGFRLVRSRGELMMLPAGVTKGAGLLKALGDRGLSQYNTIGVVGGDDYSLLDVFEIGVAVCGAAGQASRT